MKNNNYMINSNKKIEQLELELKICNQKIKRFDVLWKPFLEILKNRTIGISQLEQINGNLDDYFKLCDMDMKLSIEWLYNFSLYIYKSPLRFENNIARDFFIQILQIRLKNILIKDKQELLEKSYDLYKKFDLLQLASLNLMICNNVELGVIKKRTLEILDNKIDECFSNAVDPQRTKKAFAMLSKILWILPEDCITKFHKILPLQVIINLALAVEQPHIIKQPEHTNLCGPTAIITCLFTEKPDIIIEPVWQMFVEGNYKGDALFMMEPSVQSKQQEQNIITAITCAMKNASNKTGYDYKYGIRSLGEKWRGLTEPKKMVDYLNNAHYNNVVEDIRIIMPGTVNCEMPLLFRNFLCTPYSKSHIKRGEDTRECIINNLIQQNKTAILLISSNSWRCIKNKWITSNNEKFTNFIEDDVVGCDDYEKYHLEEFRGIFIQEPKDRKSLIDIGHYVYLRSLSLDPNQEDHLKCVFYADGIILDESVSKQEFLKGLSGIIDLELSPELLNIINLEQPVNKQSSGTNDTQNAYQYIQRKGGKRFKII